jgi:hypothetical protein
MEILQIHTKYIRSGINILGRVLYSDISEEDKHAILYKSALGILKRRR